MSSSGIKFAVSKISQESVDEHSIENDLDSPQETEFEYDPVAYPYGPYYEEITERHLKEIAFELGLIKLSWPEKLSPVSFKRKHYPPSYSKNTNKEKLLLLYTENLRRQFHFIYTDRRPLFLAAENEQQLQKMVCTTIRPTTIHYPEMCSWDTCAQFIADHLEYEPLDKPTLLPERMLSPTWVLENQRGHCFEFSTVLCSYLIGTGYEAYVVSGYASREFCLNDQTSVANPFIKHADEGEGKEASKEEPKYQIKPPRDLRSKYLLEMEQREERRKESEWRRRKEEQQRAVEEYERPAPDRLFGVRVHSWVAILPGKRGVTEPFFIEPSIGNKYPLSCPHYLGVESLWDHTNYWINLQDCSQGCKDLKFNLKDVSCWQHLLIGEPWETRKMTRQEDEKDEILQEKHLDMPASWVERLNISQSKFMERFPMGSRKVTYKKSKLERYAPYIQRDGLTMRIITFEDYDWDQPQWVYETYSNRYDFLEETKHNLQSTSIVDIFRRGREDALKEHCHYQAATSVEDERTLFFYDMARMDGLWKVEMHPLFLTEHYNNRYDFLYYRHVEFESRNRSGSSAGEGIRRTVMKVTENFHRDPSKKADDDIATRIFALVENQILLKYHYDDDRVTAQTREFIKPTDLSEKLVFNPSITCGYQVDPTKAPAKQLDLFYLLEQQLAAEQATLFHIREMEDEVAVVLRTRAVESAVPRLQISVFDKERNEKSKEGMKEKDKALEAQSKREVEVNVDYLSPYVARMGNPSYLTQRQAAQLRDECLSDYKKLLVERANHMQTKFEEGMQILQLRHHWYEDEQENLTRQEEEEYFEFSNHMTFQLHTLEIRLNRHRDLAPQRYLTLENCLRADSRLHVLYW